MERVPAALTRLETRMDTTERASPGRRADGRNVAQAAFAGSEFRRAIDGGSALGCTSMHIDELSAMGPFGAGN
ncbi:unnamed protein product [Peronospora farinosa]|uniref:Uncharacterized protein n=1 Tax=Peronospora farinosa TaxID=134698 RepID=A0AAV0TSK6_9STRA|nr:unnamed protein product [Peronospora farinosa]